MRIYLQDTVLEAAKRRLGWVFDEFPNVVCNVSGGKDSTVLFHLALEVAREKDRLPLKVLWIDQEAEWASTVEIVREWMHHPDVEPIWLQIPFRIFNATSATDHWLHAWDPAAEDRWIHPHDPAAITDNVFGEDRFARLFTAVMSHYFPGEPAAGLSGVRCEESPARMYGLTSYETYKGETWGTAEGKKNGHYAFYPLYDWAYTDIWKAILDHGWNYCRLYDLQYRYGVPVRNMRVSNLHHETAVRSLFYLQEFEPETYERLTQRIGGVDSAAKLGFRDYFPEQLPPMFSDWREYRDYLLEHLIDNPEWRAKMATRFASGERRFDPSIHEEMRKAHVRSILVNDWEGILVNNFETAQPREVRTNPTHRKGAI